MNREQSFDMNAKIELNFQSVCVGELVLYVCVGGRGGSQTFPHNYVTSVQVEGFSL